MLVDSFYDCQTLNLKNICYHLDFPLLEPETIKYIVSLQ